MTNTISQGTAVNQTNDAQSIILEHAKKNFSLAPAEIELTEASSEGLPPGVKQYYLEKKGSHGNVSYNYLMFNKNVYSSGVDGDLQRFLKDYGFLQKQGTADLFVKLLRVFSLPRNINVINAETLRSRAEQLKNYQDVSAPKMTQDNSGGAIVTFFTTPIVPFQPEKWVATLSSDYKVKIEKHLVARVQ